MWCDVMLCYVPESVAVAVWVSYLGFRTYRYTNISRGPAEITSVPVIRLRRETRQRTGGIMQQYSMEDKEYAEDSRSQRQDGSLVE